MTLAHRCVQNIRAIIRNSRANQDGHTNGITLPNRYAQEALARKAFGGVDYAPTDVQYVEVHGTGTAVGDVLELNAINDVFCEVRTQLRAGSNLLTQLPSSSFIRKTILIYTFELGS